jgi:hypothetical protein
LSKRRLESLLDHFRRFRDVRDWSGLPPIAAAMVQRHSQRLTWGSDVLNLGHGAGGRVRPDAAGGPLRRCSRADGNDGGKNHDHAYDGMAAAHKSLGFPSVSEF